MTLKNGIKNILLKILVTLVFLSNLYIFFENKSIRSNIALKEQEIVDIQLKTEAINSKISELQHLLSLINKEVLENTQWLEMISESQFTILMFVIIFGINLKIFTYYKFWLFNSKNIPAVLPSSINPEDKLYPLYESLLATRSQLEKLCLELSISRESDITKLDKLLIKEDRKLTELVANHFNDTYEYIKAFVEYLSS